MPHHATSLLYVCIISGFNQPELEACLTHKPDDLILIVSNDKHIQNAAKLFTEVLQAELPQLRIHRPDDGHSLDAEDIECCQLWVNEALRPLIESPEFKDRERVLNFTGGTKAQTAVLLTALDWNGLDYKALNAHHIQRLHPTPGARTYAVEHTPFIDASPSAIARLHNQNVKDNNPVNPLCKMPGSLPLAQRIWDALTAQDPALEALFTRFGKVWGEGRKVPRWNHPSLTLDWSELGDPPTAAERRWLDALAVLAPSVIEDKGEQLVLPGNTSKNKKQNKYLRDWISGIWLEQLVLHWVIEAGIPEGCVVSNIAGSPEGDEHKRELDLLLNYQGQAKLIEIKTDFPVSKESQDMEKQISSLGDRFGRTKKLLFIGPQGKQQLDSGKISATQPIDKERFIQRCKVSGITLIDSKEKLKEELFASIRGKSGS